MIDVEKIKFLQNKAKMIRRSIIEMLSAAGSGHTAGPLGMADVFAALYFHLLKHDPKNSRSDDRDRLVVSNGHIAPVLYATLAHAGYFPIEELKTLRKFGSRLQGHPHRDWLPIMETSSGPLGSGLSQAAGMALADKTDRNHSGNHYFYCVTSDGEMECGETWEAAMFAGRHQLHNLIAIVDRNKIQIDGPTEEVMPLEPLADKLRSFNWHVIEIDGHNFEQIVSAVEQAKAVLNKPSVIVARTIPGKGVSEFEGKFEWHGKVPNQAQAAQALKELQ